MGFLGFFKKLFASKRWEAMGSDENRTTEPLVFEKSSLELGVAAGYTAHFIKQIESALNRIETQMPTKDWFVLQFAESISKRLDAIEASLSILLQRFSGSVTRATGAVSVSEAKLTPKMLELVETVKKAKEISYEDLAKKLEISIPSLRGLLSETIRQVGQMERFEKKNKGWVRFTGNGESIQAIQSDSDRTESLHRDQFESLVQKLGYTITQRYYTTPPDYILSKNGDKFAVKIIAKTDVGKLEKALGQLIYAKAAFTPTELWLIVTENLEEEWLKILKKNGIRVFRLSEANLEELKPIESDQVSNQLNMLSPEDS